MPRYDVAVVGGGPAGSTAAYYLARSGARVVVLDRARFPRDKPCGGGVTVRARNEAPAEIAPVVEHVVDRVRFSFRLGGFFEYAYPRPLVYMTQRHRLDAFLLDNAASAGAEVRDGVRVRNVALERDAATVTTAAGERIDAGVLVGADGANGVVARSLGLDPAPLPMVALEANFAYANGGVPHAWSDTLALELGSLPGGYGWSFPKADHFNLGCGGYPEQGRRLRPHLASLRGHYDLHDAPLANLRGHHLPTREGNAAITRGRALLVGDAAGLVDALSGEGIYAAFVSGRLAAEAAGEVLAGAQPDLWRYEAAIERELMPDIRAAAILRDAYHYAPAPCYWVLRHSQVLRRCLCELITGETTYADLMRRLGPLQQLLRLWAGRGRAARRAGAV